MSRESLAQRQAMLVAALVAGGAVPDGFDPGRVQATADALLHKRAGEVGERWPALRTQFGPQWTASFVDWARGRPPQGSLRDGCNFTRHLARHGLLTGPPATDLAVFEASYRYDGLRPPQLRRLPALRRAPGTVILQVAGHVIRLTRRGAR